MPRLHLQNLENTDRTSRQKAASRLRFEDRLLERRAPANDGLPEEHRKTRPARLRAMARAQGAQEHEELRQLAMHENLRAAETPIDS
jgi:hypothetical protein